MPMASEPSIWPSTEVRLMARPQSWASVIFSIVILPVARSTSTSTTWAEQP